MTRSKVTSHPDRYAEHTTPSTWSLVRVLFALRKSLYLYPAGHDRIDDILNEVKTMVGRAQGPRGKPLIFRIGPSTVHGQGEGLGPNPPDDDRPIVTNFAIECRKRRIQEIRFLPGITKEELLRLARLLNEEESQVLRGGGPKGVFPEKERPHLVLRVSRHGEPRARMDLPVQGGEVTRRLPGGSGEDEVSPAAQPPPSCEREPEAPAEPDPSPEPEAGRGSTEAPAPSPETIAEGPEKRPRYGHRPIPLGGIRAPDSTVLMRPPDGAIDGNKTELMDSLLESYHGMTARAEADDENDSSAAIPSPAQLQAALDPVVFDEGAFFREFRGHDYACEKVQVLAELLEFETDPDRYESKRRHLLGTFARADLPIHSFVSGAVHVARLPEVSQFEEPLDLAAEILASTTDPNRVVRVFREIRVQRPPKGDTGGEPPPVEELLHRYLAHAKEPPFSVVARLITLPAMGPLRGIMEDVFLNLLRTEENLVGWALSDPDQFYHPQIFAILLHLPVERVKSTVEEILRLAKNRDRRRLFNYLKASASPETLDLLLVALEIGEPEIRREVIDLLGRFRHPTAFETLKQIITQADSGPLNAPEVSVAIRSLATMETDESRGFLDEIVRSRRGLRHQFRKEIRQMAVEAVKERSSS